MTLHGNRQLRQDSATAASPQASPRSRLFPLVVSFEGGLVSSNLRLEMLALSLPAEGFSALQHLAGDNSGTPAPGVAEALPYQPSVLQLIDNARAGGAPVYLLTRSWPVLAQSALDHLGCFDGLILVDGTADAVATVAGQTGHTRFDYAGPTGGVIAAAADRHFGLGMAQAARDDGNLLVLSRRKAMLPALIRLLRPHQYAKNALVLVPLLTSHSLGMVSLLQAVIAFLAFSMAASAVYVLNDFADMRADRGHPGKKKRPFAAGDAGLAEGLMLIPLLLTGSAILALQLPPLFGALLAVYLVLTTAYTFVLKRMMLVDVTVLSLLYTLRVVAGAAAISVPVSEWLFAFSLLMFTALALTKRHVELSTRLDRDLPDPSDRDYKVRDLPVIAALAAAAGMNAITVLALYVNSDSVTKLYQRPQLLWLLCPLFLYWTSRMLLLAHRRQMHDDPIVFALTDRQSWITGGLSLLLMAVAM